MNILVDGVVVATVAIPATGGWQTWTTITSNSFELLAGNHTFRLQMVGSSFNINYFEFQKTN